jgi:hypothetical protein
LQFVQAEIGQVVRVARNPPVPGGFILEQKCAGIAGAEQASLLRVEQVRMPGLQRQSTQLASLFGGASFAQRLEGR